MTIWGLVSIAVVFVLVAILVFRLHAFLALLATAFLVAALTPVDQLERFSQMRVDDGAMSSADAATFMDASPSKRVADALGRTAGSIGIVIALASVIGSILFHSGAAAAIVDSILRLTGPGRAPEAMAAGSFLLGIPVFFDTVFYLMMPIARSLRARVGRDYVLFILAILAGGSITHSLIPPTPGPLQVAELLNVEVGVMLIAGLGIGSITSVFSLMAARVINRLVEVPLREGTGPTSPTNDDGSETASPPIWLAVLPIVLPVLLIATASILKAMPIDGPAAAWLAKVFVPLGDKNIALAVGCIACVSLWRWIAPATRPGIVSAALASAGGIILITSAGGALGKMFYQAGIAQAVGSIATGFPGLLLLPLVFVVTTAIRTIQGSATIAMITSASILQGLAASDQLPYHPVYLAMAIGAGSKPISWMTDSAFWIISEMSGMTEREALRTISPMSVAVGVSALLTTMMAAALIPGI
ncbi:MAG: gluconate permease [Planctomycetota bacterium]